jgi:xylose isomerase
MTEPFFPGIEAIHYEGPDTQNPLAYRYYEGDRIVLGKRRERVEPRPCSGRQEMLGNLLNRHRD